jgi:hypothetical protein
MLRVYRQPRRRPTLDTVELQALIDEARREHAARSPKEAALITTAAVSQWTADTRPSRVFSDKKGRSA